MCTMYYLVLMKVPEVLKGLAVNTTNRQSPREAHHLPPLPLQHVCVSEEVLLEGEHHEDHTEGEDTAFL